jgi:hypothetical protein
MPADKTPQKTVSVVQIEWCGIAIEITHVSPWSRVAGIDHIEVRSGGRVPLPITDTGYRSLFIYPEQFSDYDSAADYVRAWLDDEARGGAWKRAQEAGRQLSLF